FPPLLALQCTPRWLHQIISSRVLSRLYVFAEHLKGTPMKLRLVSAVFAVLATTGFFAQLHAADLRPAGSVRSHDADQNNQGGVAAGPDCTLSNVNGIQGFGPIGGVRAYILGADTCNIGTANLAWTNDSTPGLFMNAYRLANGRMMQIGMSWGKTACCAAA